MRHRKIHTLQYTHADFNTMIAPGHFAAYSQATAQPQIEQPANITKPTQPAPGKSKKKRTADSKSLNAPYIKLTPILSDGYEGADMDVDLEVAPTQASKSNNCQDAILVFRTTTMTGIY
jgi:hypothetical protein